MSKPIKPKMKSFLNNIWNRIKAIFINRILTGLAVIIPLGVTFYIVQFFYFFLANRLTPLTRKYLTNVPEYVVPISSIIFLLLGIYLLGFLTNLYIGSKLFSLFEWFLEKIPFIKTLYVSMKKIVSIFTQKKEEEETVTSGPVVFIDFPFPGAKNIAFVTNDIEIEGLGKFKTVFVPTVPNPTSGYFQLVPHDFVYDKSPLPIDEATTMILSAGFVTPESLKVKEDNQQPQERAD